MNQGCWTYWFARLRIANCTASGKRLEWMGFWCRRLGFAVSDQRGAGAFAGGSDCGGDWSDCRGEGGVWREIVGKSFANARRLFWFLFF